MKKIIACLTLVLLLTGNAHAYFFNGNELHAWFQGDVSQHKGYAYVAGVADATSHKGDYCLPSSVTVGQLGDLVKKLLAESPEYRHFSANTLVVTLFGATWPCAK